MTYTTFPKIEQKHIDTCLSDYISEQHYKKTCNANVTLIKDRYNSKGQCFNYATKNYTLKWCEECFEYIEEYYKEISIEEIKKGDIVVFSDGYDGMFEEYNVQHFAIIVKTDNTIANTIIRSKWGKLAIYEGSINDLPDIYGDMIKFYRKK